MKAALISRLPRPMQMETVGDHLSWCVTTLWLNDHILKMVAHSACYALIFDGCIHHLKHSASLACLRRPLQAQQDPLKPAQSVQNLAAHRGGYPSTACRRCVNCTVFLVVDVLSPHTNIATYPAHLAWSSRPCVPTLLHPCQQLAYMPGYR